MEEVRDSTHHFENLKIKYSLCLLYVPEGNQVDNKEKYLFIEGAQLVDEEVLKGLKYHHFAIRNEIMGIGKAHQCFLKDSQILCTYV